MDYRSSDDVANRGTERESIDYCYSCAHGMMNSKNRADPCCYNYQGPLGKYGKNKYWNCRAINRPYKITHVKPFLFSQRIS
ncbi:hypothetical protein MCOR27_008287 [Pyricularia oryzae]|nr:hypothetical protein MCOR19_011631 [Pyricularia oryzae]KAI6264962.1 hypothetical protein MCOR26_011025 [Pyricularia oryzae]KAI6272612.1 hypothetical protein MCOR27_008287 [Pyricularia oryzae]KAI6291949.1 hypothetical protein MCOR29_011710 [Pyricularia oryzae]KAI6404434.1 hypothetical protein MCOR24_008001 [Pyricularia oryzae]